MPRKLPKGRSYMAVCQKLVPLVNIKIAGKWMFMPLKMVLIGIDPYPIGNTLKKMKKGVHEPCAQNNQNMSAAAAVMFSGWKAQNALCQSKKNMPTPDSTQGFCC
jgi:hypothetical protein